MISDEKYNQLAESYIRISKENAELRKENFNLNKAVANLDDANVKLGNELTEARWELIRLQELVNKLTKIEVDVCTE